jgi:hypothetical protein
MKKWSLLDRWSLRILGVLLCFASGLVFLYAVVVLWGGFASTDSTDSIEFWILLLVGGIVGVPMIGAGIVGFYFGWRVFLSADDTE